MTSYQEVEQWMFEKLKRYQSIGAAALNPGLDRIISFAQRLENPHKNLKSIHVGGTNGKGSTSHMLASILQEAGYKVGLYTSPHLKKFTERIRINREEISEQFVIDFMNDHKDFAQEHLLSFFELTVGMAFDYFAKEQVDIAIIEVGMGGRLDATNIITPELSVITNIGFDHMKFLGNTLPKIAVEKAGIIKPNIPVIIGERQEETADVFLDKAKETDSEINFASDNQVKCQTDLLGSYQLKNANTAVHAINQLKGFDVSEESIKKGLKNVVSNTNLRGRWEVLKTEPLVVCDTGHNREGLLELISQIRKLKVNELFFVLGFVNDKDLDSILDLFPKNAAYLFCSPSIQRGLDPMILKEKANQYGLNGTVFSSVSEAYEKSLELASKSDMIFIGGSTFVVAEVI